MQQTCDARAVTNSTPNSCVDVPVLPVVTVTYAFVAQGEEKVCTRSSKLRGLAYVPAAGDSPDQARPLEGFEEPARLGDDKVISVKVRAGQTVGLFLGSDAKNGYRKHLLYQVRTDSKDVQVTIREQPGLHDGTDTPTLERADEALAQYSAALTGDVWLRASHVYTADEVDELVADLLPPLARQAVRAIYDGSLEGPPWHLHVPMEGQRIILLRWQKGFATNARQHIRQPIDERRDILPRVHPACYGVVLRAAFEAGIDTLEVSSGWRPMLGSVLHRMGIGLDVVALERNAATSRLRRTYTEAEGKAKKAVAEAQHALKELLDQKPPDHARIQAARRQLKEAEEAYARAIRVEESADVRRFREVLLGMRDHVRQIFDPWQMEPDTGDGVAPTLNKLETDNERVHHDHLHITIHDPLLGYQPLTFPEVCAQLRKEAARPRSPSSAKRRPPA